MYLKLRSLLTKKLAADPLLQNRDFLRYWLTDTLISFGNRISGFAIPLTAVLLLHATPSQMGTLIAVQMAPFALFALPVGVWMDRRSKFPIFLRSIAVIPFVLAGIVLAHTFGVLTMPWLYLASFVLGTCFLIGSAASQVFLTHLVGRDHLVQAYGKMTLTDSSAQLLGPGVAGLLVQYLSAPLAILADAAGLVCAWWNLRRIVNPDPRPAPSDSHPLRDMLDGLMLVKNDAVLCALAWGTGLWQLLYHGYVALQILFATRDLGMSAGLLGAAQMAGGLGILASSLLISLFIRKFGNGATILIGMGGTALAWLLLPFIPAALFGSALASAGAYAVTMFVFDCSAMLFVMPYLALRQKVTPDAFLGRMVSTMRFLTIAVAPAGALIAGWLAERYGVRSALAALAGGGLLLTVLLVSSSPLRHLRD